MPRRSSGTRGRRFAVLVEVAGEQRGQLVERGLGAVALRFEDDLVPNFAPSDNTASMLRAGTGFLSPVRMVTGTDSAPAAATNRAAGRACSPLVDPTMTAREAMRDAPIRTVRLDGDLDRFPPFHDAESFEGTFQRERWVIRSATGTVPDAMSSSACALWAGLEPLAPDDRQLPVVHEVRVDGDQWVFLRQPAEETDPALPGGHAHGLLLGATRRRRRDDHGGTVPVGELPDLVDEVVSVPTSVASGRTMSAAARNRSALMSTRMTWAAPRARASGHEGSRWARSR
jgi:hypothetical protein